MNPVILRESSKKSKFSAILTAIHNTNNISYITFVTLETVGKCNMYENKLSHGKNINFFKVASGQ